MFELLRFDCTLSGSFKLGLCGNELSTKVKVIWQGQGQTSRSQFSKKNGHRGGICVSQTHLVLSLTSGDIVFKIVSGQKNLRHVEINSICR